MARQRRIKLERSAYYHIISRVANKAFLLEGSEIKNTIVRMLYRAADFSGIHVVSYVVMDNHFHLCIEVPDKKDIPKEEVIRRIGILYGDEKKDQVIRHLERLEEAGYFLEANLEIDRYRSRMGDLSEFMKTFKQRLTQWFNMNHHHEGTLWDGRFKSLLLENGPAVKAVVGYIHMNPVRAKIVEKAEDYPWSTAGAAVQSDKEASKGLSLDVADKRWLTRERKLIQGGIMGSQAFVEELSIHFKDNFHGVHVSPRPVRLGGSNLYMTHGQRSA